MRLIKILFGLDGKKDTKSFADFSAREKKALIKAAAREANKMQKDLVEEYDRKFGATDQKKVKSNGFAMGL